MGSETSAPLPSTGGDNPLMDAASGSFGGGFDAPSCDPPAMNATPTPDLSSMGDVGLGQTNNLADVQAVNSTLNDFGIQTPHGPDVVDTNAIKAGQTKLSEVTGVNVKADGWVGDQTKGTFQYAQDRGLTNSLKTTQADDQASNTLSSPKPPTTAVNKPATNTLAGPTAMTNAAQQNSLNAQKTKAQTAQAAGTRAYQLTRAKSGHLPKLKKPAKIKPLPGLEQAQKPKIKQPGFQGLAGQAAGAGQGQQQSGLQVDRLLAAKKKGPLKTGLKPASPVPAVTPKSKPGFPKASAERQGKLQNSCQGSPKQPDLAKG